MRSAIRDLTLSVLVLATLIGLWAMAHQLGWANRAFLPSPAATVKRIAEAWEAGMLANATWATALRMLQGWILASLLGIALGALIGNSKRARILLQPTLEFIRPLPASAMLPVAATFLGLTSGMVLFVVAFGAMWPVLLATIHGVVATHPQLREVARALELSPASYLLKLGLPNAMPEILAGMRLALTVSLIVSVVGEMMTSQPGLGSMILTAARSFRSDEMFAGIALLCLLGLASNILLIALERYFLAWMIRR